MPAKLSNTSQPKLAVLWTKAQPVVRAFIRSNVFYAHDTDDLIQMVAVTVTEKFDQYDPDRSFAAWAIGIAKNHLRDYRKRGYRDRLSFDTDVIDQLAQAHLELKPNYNTMFHALEHCVGKLKVKSRQLLELRYSSDLTAPQIADRLAVSPGAVRTGLHRIRAALADCMNRRLSQGGESA